MAPRTKWILFIILWIVLICGLGLFAATALSHRAHRCEGRAGCYYHVFKHQPDWVKAKLRRVSACESDYPSQHDPSGTYHGAFQYDLRTAGEAGFRQDPHTVSYRQQAVRTWRFAMRVGWGRWPHCGYA